MNDVYYGSGARLREIGSGNGSLLEGSEMDREMDLMSGSQVPLGAVRREDDLDDIDAGDDERSGDAIGHPRSSYVDGQDIARSGPDSNLSGDPAMDQGIGGAGSIGGIDNDRLDRDEAMERSRRES